MTRILLIDGDRARLAALELALGEAGYGGVAGVSSGTFALTMLERDRPDLIVCQARLPDFDGYELCEIVRSDPALRGVLILLLAGPEDELPGPASEIGADRFLVGEFTLAAVVAEVRTLLPQDARALAAAPPAAPAHDLRGSLEVMELADLVQAIALGGKTGHLVLTLGGRQGQIAFERGRVVHAELGALAGEAAFAALLAAARQAPDGTFCFIPLDRRAASLPRTIARAVDQLLLDAAAAIDEGRLRPAGAEPVRGGR